jgi:hypothetical protein
MQVLVPLGHALDDGVEFGRTPRINRNGGVNLALSGGRFRTGQVIGESMSKADVPKTAPITPQDLMAIPSSSTWGWIHINQVGRPAYVLEQGTPISELV